MTFFYIDILMYWFSFRGLCCMPTLPENCDSFSHRLAECAVQRRGWRCLRLVGVYIHQVRENCTRSFSITKIILRGRHAELSPLARGGALSHSVVVVSLLAALLLSSLWKKSTCTFSQLKTVKHEITRSGESLLKRHHNTHTHTHTRAHTHNKDCLMVLT